MSTLKTIYVAAFQFSTRRWHGDKETASVLTVVTMTGAIVMNLGFAIIISHLTRGKGLGLPTSITGLIAPVIGLWLYLSCVQGRRYEALERAFSLRPQIEQRRWRRIALAYLAGSYLITSAAVGILAFVAPQG